MAQGYGNLSLADVTSFSGDFGAVSSQALGTRIARAMAGNVTAGGAVSPREAAAYVFGYLVVRYIPARHKQGKLDVDKAKVLGQIAGKFSAASLQPTDADAVKAALAVGAGSAPIDTLKGALGSLFDRFTSDDPSRAWALQVLKHAAAVVAAAGEPLAASKLAIAAGGSAAISKEVEQGLLSSITSGAKDIVAQAKEAAQGLPTILTPQEIAAKGASAVAEKAKDIATAAVNLAVKTAETAKEGAQQAATQVVQNAEKLASAGAGEVKEKLDAVVDLAKKAAELEERARTAVETKVREAAIEARDAVQEKLKDAASDFKQALDTVRETGTAAQKALADELTGKVRSAVQVAEDARTAIARAESAVGAAVKDKLLDLNKAAAETHKVVTKFQRGVLFGGIALVGIALLLLIVFLARRPATA